MTEPLLAELTPAEPEEQPPPPPVRFPLVWLFEQDAPALHYRALVDVARVPDLDPSVQALPLTSRNALALSLTQHPDGRWNERMLTIPPARGDSFEGVGTIPAVQRLVEYGFDRETPPILQARRLLFRLLAEDDDPSLLHELRTQKMDEDLIRRGRVILREAAAAVLAQAGFEADPRLRGAARRIIERIDGYLASPLAEKPWIRVGNKQVLSPDAYPPSFHSLQMLAFMPLLRHEHYAAMNRIYDYLVHPMPRQDSTQLVGKKIVAQPHLVLGDPLPHRNAVDADVPFALFWLEMMARLNYLRRNDNWLKLYDRFLEDCDQTGVWHPHKGMEIPRSRESHAWAYYPLVDSSTGDARWADATFRIGVIARLLGRDLEFV